jgi:hypothetical protein
MIFFLNRVNSWQVIVKKEQESIFEISKIGFWLKIKAGLSFNPQTY